MFHVCQNGLDSREAWCISKPSPISRIWIIVIIDYLKLGWTLMRFWVCQGCVFFWQDHTGYCSLATMTDQHRSAGGILSDGAMTHMTPHQISAILRVCMCKIRHPTVQGVIAHVGMSLKRLHHTPHPILHSNPRSTMWNQGKGVLCQEGHLLHAFRVAFANFFNLQEHCFPY